MIACVALVQNYTVCVIMQTEVHGTIYTGYDCKSLNARDVMCLDSAVV